MSSTFDHSRVQVELYNSLKTPLDVCAFLNMASDYVSHLREDPKGDKIEIEAAERFVSMINNDRAWPLVKFSIRDFRDRTALNDPDLPRILRYVVESVQARITEPQAFLRSNHLDRMEDLTQARVAKARIDALIYHLEGEENASDEHRQVADQILVTMQRALEKCEVDEDEDDHADAGIREE